MITLTETLKPYWVKFQQGCSYQSYLVLAENDQSAEAKARKALNIKRAKMEVKRDDYCDGWIL